VVERVTQLRTYTINRGALQAFAEEWQTTIKPLREKLGFRVPAAWTVKATNQFVWLLSLEDSSTWDALERAYHDSDERREMQPDPARHIARMENYFVEPVELKP